MVEGEEGKGVIEGEEGGVMTMGQQWDTEE